MDDPLNLLLQRLEVDPPVFYGDEVQRHLASVLPSLQALGILQAAPSASSASCLSCGGDHRRPVTFILNTPTGQRRGYINCPDCGPVEIGDERLARWKVDILALLRAALSPAAVKFSLDEIVANRLWRIGKVTWAGRSRELLFVRTQRRADKNEVVAELSRRPKAILFVPTELSAGRWVEEVRNLLVPLESVIALDGDAWTVDVQHVESLLVDAGLTGTAQKKSQPKKRGSRTADIEALTKEMMAHVRAARDHAVNTRDRTGTPKLLPRPTQVELSKRTGISETSVHRTLKDKSASNLQFLWELSLDLDRLLSYRS